MSRELDLRGANRLGNKVNAALPAASGLETPTGFFVQRALDAVRAHSRALGLSAVQPPEFAADPHVLEASSGAVAVHLSQQFKGIPIFDATQTVRFGHDGSLGEMVGASVEIEDDLPLLVTVRPEEAAVIAARHVASPEDDARPGHDLFGEPVRPMSLDVSDYNPRVVAAFRSLATQPTLLEAGPFASFVRANLVWFPIAQLRLAWDVVLTLPQGRGQFRVVVDAQDRRLLYATELVRSIAARGHLYRVDAGRGRELVDFPLPASTYGLPIPPGLPADFPGAWVATDSTAGDTVIALPGDADDPLRASPRAGALEFDPADPFGAEQRILNLFYFNCFLHDYFYLLGFREADGNFQLGNFSRGGLPGDRVVARAHDGAVYATANMTTPADGTAPVMNMGFVKASKRHTALDATVVIHEFSHGVTTRLVGGPLNAHGLDAPQSSAMGEGWGDYFACSITGVDTIAAWVVDRPAGIRGFRYDQHFPDHFGSIGTGRYTEIHNVGEIWAAMLLELNRRIGAPLTGQLVVDALKLSPASPTFLDMRDAWFAALEAKKTARQLTERSARQVERDAWSVFAKFGMGPKASCGAGAALSATTPDFNPPADETAASTVQLVATPLLAIPDKNPSGITSVLTVTQSGIIRRITISVDIQHTYAGDLRVLLSAPDGSTFLLHSEGIDDTANLLRSYSERDPVSMATLLGRSAQGPWTLRVADLFRTSVGVLRGWRLELELAR